MAVVNVMEKVVKDVLYNNLKQINITCKCERCLNDIQAHALNHLKPRYIVNQDYQPYVRAVHEVNQNEAIHVLKIVTQAATVISEHPRCDNAKKEQ